VRFEAYIAVRKIYLVLVPAGIVAAAFSGEAAVVRFLELEELTSISDLIVQGEVRSVDPAAAAAAENARPSTRVTLLVQRTLRGAADGDEIAFDLPGGYCPGTNLYQAVPGVPAFSEGEEILVFLRSDPTLFCPVAGWDQGKFEILVDRETGGKRVFDSYGKFERYRRRRAGIADHPASYGTDTLDLDEFCSLIAEIREEESLQDAAEPSPDSPAAATMPPSWEVVLADYNYSGFKWRDSSLPVPYYTYIGLNPPTGVDLTDYVNAVRAAFQTWQNVATSYMAYSYRGETATYKPDTSRTDGRNVVGWTDENLGSALAMTVYWYSFPGGYLEEFDIVIEQAPGGSLRWSTDTPTPFNAYDLQSVVLHEAGHTLSLDHVNDPTQVMYYSISNGQMRRQLGQGDIAGITFIYPKSGDLIVPRVQGPATALEYESIELSATIRNQGGATTGSCRVNFYLSLSSSIAPKDILLGYGDIPQIARDEEYTVRVTVPLPSVGAERDFYVNALADADQRVAESNEENNTGGYFPLKVRLDSDGDGLPNWWEEKYGLDPYDATGDNGPDGDPDGDGLVNSEEFAHGTHPRIADTDGDGQSDGDEVLAGTDPLDKKSFFHVAQIVILGTGDERWVSLSWTSVPGKQYQVYYQDEPGTAWFPLGPVHSGTGTLMGQNDSAGVSFPLRIYRVGVQ
jgi:hypothetical protein